MSFYDLSFPHILNSKSVTCTQGHKLTRDSSQDSHYVPQDFGLHAGTYMSLIIYILKSSSFAE